MSQQITIIIFVSTQTALEDNSLKGNVYLIDNLRTEGSKGEGTDKLITRINGNFWCDGSQSRDVVLNWFVVGIDSLPPTLPRNYIVQRSKDIDREWLQSIKNSFRDNASNDMSDLESIEHMIENAGSTESIIDSQGNEIDLGIKALNIFGEPFEEPDSQENSNNGNSSGSDLSYLPPMVSDITGSAVDNHVIFPAQYGTPVPIKDGWYWSATVDTNKTGIHDYTLHLTFYKRNGTVWVPVEMTHDVQIEITNEAQINGFSHAGMEFLPIV